MSTAAPAPAPRPRSIRHALKHTEAPLAWKLAITAAVALALGSATALIIGLVDGRVADAFADVAGATGKSIPAGLVTMFAVLAGVMVPREKSLIAAVAASLMMTAAMILAWATIGTPWAAGLVMALVMGVGPIATRRGGVVAGVATLLASAYFVFSVIGLVRGLGAMGVLYEALIGGGTAIAILVVLWLIHKIWGIALAGVNHAPSGATTEPGPVKKKISRERKAIDSHTIRYAIIRGVLLGVTAGIYAADPDHNLFWVLLTLWCVMQPALEDVWERGIQRVVGVMAGCIVLAVLAQFIPGGIILGLGGLSLFVGILWMQRDYAVYSAAISIFTVALHGAQHNAAFVQYSWFRFIDTLVGAALVYVVLYLVMSVPDRIAERSRASHQQG